MRKGLQLAVVLLSACSSGGETPSPLPVGGLYATFSAAGEIFRTSITHPDGIAQARATWAGTSNAHIPIGDLVCSSKSWNAPWHWHMDPESVRMAEVTIELCDGMPSFVEANCVAAGGGQFCPWSAQLVELRDCSTDPTCPVVPR